MERSPAGARIGLGREARVAAELFVDAWSVAEDDGGREAVTRDRGRLGEQPGGTTHSAAHARLAERVDLLEQLERARLDVVFQLGPTRKSVFACDCELRGRKRGPIAHGL